MWAWQYCCHNHHGHCHHHNDDDESVATAGAATTKLAPQHQIQPTALQFQSWSLMLHHASSLLSSLPPPHLVLLAPIRSGKTMVYGLPLVVVMMRTVMTWGRLSTLQLSLSLSLSFSSSLVIVPTCELALKVQQVLQQAVANDDPCSGFF